jgi:hypothetical protein
MSSTALSANVLPLHHGHELLVALHHHVERHRESLQENLELFSGNQ